jgi:hypothetical protein
MSVMRSDLLCISFVRHQTDALSVRHQTDALSFADTVDIATQGMAWGLGP